MRKFLPAIDCMSTPARLHVIWSQLTALNSWPTTLLPSCSHPFSPRVLGWSPLTTKLSCCQVYVFLKWLPLYSSLPKMGSVTTWLPFQVHSKPFPHLFSSVLFMSPDHSRRRGSLWHHSLKMASFLQNVQPLSLNFVNVCTFTLEFKFLDNRQVCWVSHYDGGSVILCCVLPTLYLKISTRLRT